MIQSCVENLCNGIILRAIKDYKKAQKDHDTREIRNIEKFFRSGWFEELTDVDCEYLISLIKKR